MEELIITLHDDRDVITAIPVHPAIVRRLKEAGEVTLRSYVSAIKELYHAEREKMLDEISDEEIHENGEDTYIPSYGYMCELERGERLCERYGFRMTAQWY